MVNISQAEAPARAAHGESVLGLSLSIATTELASRMRDRLADLASPPPSAVVWQRDGREVVIQLDSLVVRTLEGWLLCDLVVQSDQTGRALLQLVFFLGSRDERPGVQAACTISAPELAAAQLADAWGDDLQRVLWDAVLDVVEAAVEHASEVSGGTPVTLRAFHCDGDAIGVDLLSGEL